MTELRGEYIWDGHYLSDADIDIGDIGHEGHFEQQILSELAPHLIELAEEIQQQLGKTQEENLTDDQVEFLEYVNKYIKILQSAYEGIDPDDFSSLARLVNDAEPQSYQMFQMKNKELFDGLKDPRRWGVKQGYIISRDQSFEVWGWNQDKLKSLLNMIYEINENVDPETEIDVYDYAANKHWDFTVAQLEARESGGQITAASSKSAVHIPWTRKDLVGDHFIPQFKKWLKIHEGST